MPEEEKTLSYLSMSGGEHKNLTSAIANFEPQPFRGTYGTNFQPPGFERPSRRNDYHADWLSPGSLHRSGLLPPGLNPFSVPPPMAGSIPVLCRPGMNHSGQPFPGLPLPPGLSRPVLVRPNLPSTEPTVPDLCRPEAHHLRNSSHLVDSPSQSLQLNFQNQRDVFQPKYGGIVSVQWRPPQTPAHHLLVIGRESSDDDDDYDGEDEDREARPFGVESARSTSSARSNETVEMTSGRVSLTSSQTTPPKA